MRFHHSDMWIVIISFATEGPINSWDRQPYVSTFGDAPDGQPTAHMLPRNLSYNFLVANCASPPPPRACYCEKSSTSAQTPLHGNGEGLRTIGDQRMGLSLKSARPTDGGSNGAIDNDDESLRYENNHNFQVYGHQKFKTGAIRSYGNVIAYASEFGGHWKTPGTIADEPNAM